MKTPKGESKQAVLGNGVVGEKYVKHLKAFFRYVEKMATNQSWDWPRKPPKLRTKISSRSEEINLRTTKVCKNREI